MIERTTIEGRAATVAYITRDFQPADKTNWELAKILFDDGEMVLLSAEAPQKPAPGVKV
jgi:hypothetical protein